MNTITISIKRIVLENIDVNSHLHTIDGFRWLFLISPKLPNENYGMKLSRNRTIFDSLGDEVAYKITKPEYNIFI